jgi:cell division protein FtsI (penicillin-binding protein 3)
MAAGSSRRPPPRRRRASGGGPTAGRRARARPRRVRLLAGIAVVLLGILALRAVWLGTVRAGDLSDRGVQQNRFEADLPAQRGAIQARNGADLAIDRLAVDVTATPYLVTDPEGTAAKLGPAIERDPNKIANALARRGGYVVLAEDVPPALADRAKKLDLPGIDFSDTWQRFYPGGPQASQLVGLTGDSHEGISGMELQLEEPLTGTPGHRVEVRDLLGNSIQMLEDREPVPGENVQLTTDPRIQDRVERTLAATREKYGAKSATGIVMDPRNGEVLAMATVPRFNPNRRSQVNQELVKSRPVTDTFEPGSTFKVVTMAAALEDRRVLPGTTFALPTAITRYDRTLEDAHERPAVVLSASEILAQSSNIGTVLIAERVGATRLQAWIERFGFGNRTGIEFPGEVEGLVLPLERWSGTSIINIPIGQGIGVTLAQLTRVYAAVANGGRLVEPHLVHRVGGTDVEHPGGRQIMTARTARTLDRMLRGVVSPDGTGSLAQIEGYQVAGKTGTANKIDPETGEYSSALYTSSFVGYVPANDPQLVVSVVVDEPGGGYYGGEVAAPAFEDIAAFSLQTLNIAP